MVFPVNYVRILQAHHRDKLVHVPELKAMALFSLYIQTACLFLVINNLFHGCTFIGRHLKESVLWGTITRSLMGKQNIQPRKVYFTPPINSISPNFLLSPGSIT